jgi:hypothetical protein
VYALTDDNGLAAVELTLGTVAPAETIGAGPNIPGRIVLGPYVIRPPAGALWIITVPPGPTATMTVVAGDAQSGPVNATLPVDLHVQTMDQYGNAAEDSVSWTVTSGGGLVTAARTAPAFGHTFNRWTLGPAVGTQTVSAAVGTVHVTFSANGE